MSYSRGEMKTSEIIPGHKYSVRLSEDQSLVYRGCTAKATVIRAGFHYDVTYTRGSMVRGAPFQTEQSSTHATGVEVEWDTQQVDSLRRGFKDERLAAGRDIVNARAVRWALDE